MATPRLTPEQIAQVSGLVAQYIATQRERYASRAVPLSVQQRAAIWLRFIFSNAAKSSIVRISLCRSIYLFPPFLR
jgi:hypothetical protein